MRVSSSFLLGVASALSFSLALVFFDGLTREVGWSREPQPTGYVWPSALLALLALVSAVTCFYIEAKPPSPVEVAGFPSNWVTEYTNITLEFGVGSPQAQNYIDFRNSEAFRKFASGYDTLRVARGKGDVTKPRAERIGS